MTLLGAIVFVVGIPSALSFGLLSHVQLAGKGVFDLVDQAVSNYLLPAGGILVCLHVGWHLTRVDALAAAGFGNSWIGPVWLWLLRLVAPATISLILYDTIGTL